MAVPFGGGVQGAGLPDVWWEDIEMDICDLCETQSKKSRNGKPHEHLMKVDEVRIFKGAPPRGFEEQDYQCITCKSKFTQSTDKNDLAWTLWRG
ncbi:MAG: hypothetical protein C0617_07160 [Desulfuromonas sp.]|nr:MAG: hypothetical protein C0617_07160 [Desulfuromonas sp.]